MPFVQFSVPWSEPMDHKRLQVHFPRIRDWQDRGVRSYTGHEYGDMIGALRTFLDDVAAAVPDVVTLKGLSRSLRSWSSSLAEQAVPEQAQIFGRRFDVDGRAQTMAPCFVVAERDRTAVRGTVTFGRYFLGGGGAVHGGAIPLLFDEILGPLANSGGRTSSRTAYLNTDFRSVVPVGVELEVRGWFVSEVGRKRVLRAEIRHGSTLCAEAEALFVALESHQP